LIQTPTFWLVLFGSVVLYWMLPQSRRLGVLAVISFTYLATLAPASLIALAFWTLAFFYLAPLAVGTGPWKRRITPILILSILAYLAWFKYIPPIFDAIARSEIDRVYIIPLGISYYSFKFIHYAVEVARGNIQDRSLQRFFCYVFLFPIFTAGPIERFDHFLDNQATRLDRDDLVVGLTRIAHGLVKMFFFGGLILRPMMRGVTVDGLLAMMESQPTYKVWATWSCPTSTCTWISARIPTLPLV